MATILKLTDEIKQKLLEDFSKQLDTFKSTDGTVTISTKLQEEQTEPIHVNFTPKAFLEMERLLYHYDSEVGWHGLVTRTGEKEFLITDILVYPQIVTSATVDTDDGEYSDWLSSLDDDQFNRLRFHGHSHVRMAVAPSTTDLRHQEKLVSQLESDDFYIFMIINKDQKVNMWVYDLGTNMKYDAKDICVNIVGAEVSETFLDDADKLVRKSAPRTWSAKDTNSAKSTAVQTTYVYPATDYEYSAPKSAAKPKKKSAKDKSFQFADYYYDPETDDWYRYC